MVLVAVAEHVLDDLALLLQQCRTQLPVDLVLLLHLHFLLPLQILAVEELVGQRDPGFEELLRDGC